MQGAELKAWRRSERQRLLALRTAVPPVERRLWGTEIEAQLRALLLERPGITLGVYWPFQAEFDPRPLIDWVIAAGIVRWRCRPSSTRRARSNTALGGRANALVDGVWNIPIPERRDIVMPQAVLAPLVGFDRQCYRLGYGGGYFDRTLAALSPRPLAIGVGFEISQIETIYPQPFDIPMDVIVTEARIRRR